MITHTLSSLQKTALAIAIMASLLLFAGVTGVFAQTVPGGYAHYANGIYYNSTSGLYYNPSTGQYSNLAPLGPSQRDASGAYIVGSGYVLQSNGQYHNSTTGYYYDPLTGMYSTSVAQAMGGNTGGTFTPGVPNTGAGGEAQKAIALLVMSALVGLAGFTLLSKRTA